MDNLLTYLIVIVIILAVIWFVYKPDPKPEIKVTGPVDVNLLKTMYKLWAEHVVWTHLFIMATFQHAPTMKLVTNRLLRNQSDLGNAIIPFYGADAGQALTKLLTEHILIAGDLIQGIKIRDDDIKDTSLEKWYQNADRIVAFFCTINPFLNRIMLKNMMYDHLKFTTQEVMAQYNRDWQKDIASFDIVFDQALMMADGLTAGISKQFSA